MAIWRCAPHDKGPSQRIPCPLTLMQASYPFHASGGTCNATECVVGLPKGRVLGYKGISPVARLVPASEQALMSAVAQQPVAVGIEAASDVFQHYKSVAPLSPTGSTVGSQSPRLLQQLFTEVSLWRRQPRSQTPPSPQERCAVGKLRYNAFGHGRPCGAPCGLRHGPCRRRLLHHTG